jgi:hypothetical protein
VANGDPTAGANVMVAAGEAAGRVVIATPASTTVATPASQTRVTPIFTTPPVRLKSTSG